MEILDLIRPEIQSIKPYEPGKPPEEVERELGIKSALKLASNENPLGPSPEAIGAIQEALLRIHCYPDGHCFALRKDLASHLGVPENWLLVGNGSDEILKLITEAFLKPGEEVIIPHPSFAEYTFAAQLMGGECIYVSCRADFRFDLPAIAARVTPRTKLIFLANPNNPTGTIVTQEEVETFLDQVPERVLIVFDEAYFEYVASPHYPHLLSTLKDGRKNLVILRTFSKIYGLAGLRVGYAVAAPEVISWLGRVREPFNVNFLAQVGARAALKDKAHLDRSKSVNEAGKRFLTNAFRALGLNYVPTEANFILVDTGRDCRPVFQQLLKEGVIVRTGDIFGLPRHLRVTIGTEAQNKLFLDALKKVLNLPLLL